MGKSQNLYRKAKNIIPGGTQLLSKRPEMFLPDFWPAYYKEAKGCYVVDLDGKSYTDMSYMGIGSCILGYADSDVNKAVKRAIDSGSMSTLNAPEEFELAKVLIALHPWADMVRYARTGGEAMAMAVRIARAASRKDAVLFCGYHGWHDWYLAANLASDSALDGHLLPGLNPLGVPRTLQGTAFPFRYNDIENFLKLIKIHKNNIGVVVMESIRDQKPIREFLATIREVTKKLKIVLIVDEITAGFRLNTGGAHLLFGLKPDMAVFAKGMSNGFPMAAVIGKEEIMQRAQDTFISSTYWTDKIGPTAALATIKKFRTCNVSKHLAYVGRLVQEGWRTLAAKHALKTEISGMLPLGHFSFQYDKPLELKTLFTQLMLAKGFLATNAFYASYAHKEEHVQKYLSAVGEAFAFIAKAIKKGNPAKFLKGPVCHSGFKRLT
ncbi:MAG: aminotransferase class III-fold pyridoxal phosphate-dependent enzyme [Candidatus Omnitrophica bacterium]|nr:aminotransferase class III-fold pyridoxal phosphate-dependent enzyme [Candidatus Omnitrophota bacterium]